MRTACTLFFALALIQLSQGTSLAERRPIQPLSPQELLRLLPSAPEGWELKASHAQSSFSTWLSSMATREFKYTPPLQPGAPSPAIPISTTRIILADGGYGPTVGAPFKNFQIGKEQDVERLLVSGIPAIRFQTKEGEPQRTMLWVNDRFFVTVETTNQDQKAMDEWITRLNLAALQKIPKSDVPMSNPVTITRVDELNKRNNRSYKLHWDRSEETTVQ